MVGTTEQSDLMGAAADALSSPTRESPCVVQDDEPADARSIGLAARPVAPAWDAQ
jgi:hypothetical protein